MDVQTLHTALMRPETYLSEEGPVHFIETHVSRLYFTPKHVYKIKKPVDFGFLNFTTLDRRRFYCEEEVRLNRRFAPDTYLRVVDLRRDGGQLHVGGSGNVVEYAVLMNRLPQDRMLDRLVAEGSEDLPCEMDRLGRRVAELHERSEICRNDGGVPNLETVRFNWRENFDQTRPFAGRTLPAGIFDHIGAYVNTFLSEEGALLRERERLGFVRDAHGDLHAEHICLTEPLRIYDCIEFNRRFRVADIAADLAFLLMDLESRGRRDLSSRLLEAYRGARSGNEAEDRLLVFYKLYRAWVRGKVESFLADDPGALPEVRRQAADRAKHYFTLAAGYLCPPIMLLVGGLMGAGKTTLGRALAAPLGAELLRSDAVRKEMAGDLSGTGIGADFASGIYTPEFTRRTYDSLLGRALDILKTGGSVVVDASFARAEARDRFLLAAKAEGIPALMLFCQCDRSIALARLDRRQSAGDDLSDGRRELYDRQAALFEAAGEGILPVDTAQSVEYNVNFIILEILGRVWKRR